MCADNKVNKLSFFSKKKKKKRKKVVMAFEENKESKWE